MGKRKTRRRARRQLVDTFLTFTLSMKLHAQYEKTKITNSESTENYCKALPCMSRLGTIIVPRYEFMAIAISTPNPKRDCVITHTHESHARLQRVRNRSNFKFKLK